MTKITWKPGTLLAPVPPALISCGTLENPNIMTAAWTGIIASDPAMTYVSIRPSRYSHKLIKESGEFVINLTNLPLVHAADFCGVKSGRDINKFKETGLTAASCSQIKAPQIEEAPVSIECKVKSVVNYGTHDMFLAEIVAVNVDDKYLDEDGKLWLEKAGLVAYVHGFYYTLGRNLGKFGFSVEKKPKKNPEKKFEIKEEKASEKKTYASENKFANKERKIFRKDKNTSFSKSDKNCKKRGDEVFENHKPKRFSDNRKKTASAYGSATFSKTSQNKKFDGKAKFSKNKNLKSKRDYK